MAFMAPLFLWKQGRQTVSFKLHCMMIRMIAAPVPVEELSEQAAKAKVTKTVKQRLNDFLAGDWPGLWEAANDESFSRLQEPRTKEQMQESRKKRAAHQALHGQYRDAHQSLTGSSLLQFSPSVVEQFDEIFAHRDSPEKGQLPYGAEPHEEAAAFNLSLTLTQSGLTCLKVADWRCPHCHG
jgi:hypothetical protein